MNLDSLAKIVLKNINSAILVVQNDRIIFSNNTFLNIFNLNSLDDFEVNSDFFDKISINNSQIELNSKEFITQVIYNNSYNIIILHDVSYEKKLQEKIDSILFIDSLTKLPNRAKLIDELQSNSMKINSICLFNISAFKEINDFYGHKTGDFILKSISDFIENEISKYENMTLYKFPADNYCLVANSNDSNKFTSIIKDILQNVDKEIFYYENHELDVRLNAGISFSQKNNKLITAEIALQTAKKSNEDFIIFYEELDKFQEYENNMLWTRKLKAAFLNNSIEVFYQPLIDNITLKATKYECLVRLIEEDGRVVSPFFFLDISKKSNQYTKLTKVVIEKAFKKFENLPYEFSLNISYEDIEKDDFLPFIKSMLEKYKVQNRVIFEILEDENIKNYSVLISFIDQIKELGCKVAIDDFGTGYSNFEHILKMNADYLKIDASIIKNIAHDENSYKITKTIIEFAKSLNLQTIAEYVEDEEIFNIVKNLGADYSQGYYFSPPLASPEFEI